MLTITAKKSQNFLIHIVAMLIALGLCYLMASLAINSGSLMEYAATLILLIFTFVFLKDGLKVLWTK